MAGLPLGPLKEPGNIHDDLPVGRQFHVRAVHRTRRGPFEVNAFTVVAAAVAGALEFVLAGFPVGRATQMRAARVNDKHAVGRAVHPDAVLLLPLRIHAQRIVRGIADFENGGRFEKRARQKKTEKRDKPGAKETRDGAPHQTPPALVHSLVAGPTVARPAAAAAFEVPTAGVPT